MPQHSNQSTRQIGKHYEQQACQMLISAGYDIIATNWYCPKVGEIDIIARIAQSLPTGKTAYCLVCVEVKSKNHQNRQSTFGQAVEQVTKTKQRKIIKTLERFLADYEQYSNDDIRFDVIGFETINGKTYVDWISHAFLVD